MICWDASWPGDDVLKPAYATSSGDLYCIDCGMNHDKAEEAAEEEAADEEELPEDPDAEWMFPAPIE